MIVMSLPSCHLNALSQFSLGFSCHCRKTRALSTRSPHDIAMLEQAVIQVSNREQGNEGVEPAVDDWDGISHEVGLEDGHTVPASGQTV